MNKNFIKFRLLIVLLGFFSSLQSTENTLNYYLKKIATSLHFSQQRESINTIGLISIEGNIEKTKNIIKQLIHVGRDTTIKGLIIHIDSPGGGQIGTSQAVFSEIKKLRRIKPVIVIVGNSCCSAAYYIASAANFIFAPSCSEIGGIGIISFAKRYKDLKFNDNNQMSELIDMFIIRIGKYKASYFIPLEDHDREYIKQKAEKKYLQFIHDIAQQRNLSLENEKEWADGKAFIGIEAVELGLIDAIGDFSDALTKMQELLKITDKNTINIIELTL